jgi:hypothetical protein
VFVFLYPLRRHDRPLTFDEAVAARQAGRLIFGKRPTMHEHVAKLFADDGAELMHLAVASVARVSNGAIYLRGWEPLLIPSLRAAWLCAPVEADGLAALERVRRREPGACETLRPT